MFVLSGSLVGSKERCSISPSPLSAYPPHPCMWSAGRGRRTGSEVAGAVSVPLSLQLTAGFASTAEGDPLPPEHHVVAKTTLHPQRFLEVVVDQKALEIQTLAVNMTGGKQPP